MTLVEVGVQCELGDKTEIESGFESGSESGFESGFESRKEAFWIWNWIWKILGQNIFESENSFLPNRL